MASVLHQELVSLGEANLPIFADGMANRASLAFGALPERVVLLLDGSVVFIGGKGPEDYTVAEGAEALRSALARLE